MIGAAVRRDYSTGCARLGRREPIKSTALSLRLPKSALPNPIPPSLGMLSVEKGIPAWVRASRITAISGAAPSGTLNPQTTVVGNDFAIYVNCHLALSKTRENSIARATASGSFPGHIKVTRPGCSLSFFVRRSAWAGYICRHAVDFMIFAVPSRASAASFSKRAARSCAFAASLFASAAALFAFSPEALAAAMRPSAEVLYSSNRNSASSVSRLWALIEPTVETPTAAATMAAPITDQIKNRSQSVPENPQNNIDFWFSVLLTVSAFCVFILLIAGVAGTISMGKAGNVNKK